MTNVQWSGRIGGNKLEQNAWFVSGLLSTVTVIALEYCLEFGVKRRGAQVEINETWSGYFDFVDQVR